MILRVYVSVCVCASVRTSFDPELVMLTANDTAELALILRASGITELEMLRASGNTELKMLRASGNTELEMLRASGNTELAMLRARDSAELEIMQS